MGAFGLLYAWPSQMAGPEGLLLRILHVALLVAGALGIIALIFGAAILIQRKR